MNMKNKSIYYIIYFLFIIEIVFSFKMKYVWGDESFTLNIIKHNFLSIIDLTAQDVHPFLYYFISKIAIYNITNLFTKIFILKIISILPYLLLLIIGNTYIKKFFSSKTSKIFMFCIITMPLLMDNISSLRMYGWATLFTTIFYLIFIHSYYYNDLKSFMCLSTFALLASYTHYYSLLTVAILYILFLIFFIKDHKKIIYLIYSIIIDIVLYLPWFTILFKQTKNASHNFWTNKLSVKDSIHIIISVISPISHKSILYILPFLLIISLFLIILDNNIYTNNINVIGILTPLCLVIVGTIISFLINHSVLIGRYLTPSMGIFWLSVSMLINNKNHRCKLIKILIVLILMIGIPYYYNSIIDNINNIHNFNRNLLAFKKFPKNSIFIYNDRDIMADSASYLNNNYLLKNHNDDNIFVIYSKVFNNMKELNDTNIPSASQNIFYFKNTNFHSKNINTKNLLNNFNKKYHMKKINNLNIDKNNVDIYIVKK